MSTFDSFGSAFRVDLFDFLKWPFSKRSMSFAATAILIDVDWVEYFVYRQS